MRERVERLLSRGDLEEEEVLAVREVLDSLVCLASLMVDCPLNVRVSPSILAPPHTRGDGCCANAEACEKKLLFRGDLEGEEVLAVTEVLDSLVCC